MSKVDHCKFKQTIKIYVLTSPESMCSLICNTVRWHMDVSREGESLWPMAHPAAYFLTSLPPNLSLRFCLKRFLSSPLSILPYFQTSLCPSLSITLPSNTSSSVFSSSYFFKGNSAVKTDITWKVHVKRRFSNVVFLICTLFETGI